MPAAPATIDAAFSDFRRIITEDIAVAVREAAQAVQAIPARNIDERGRRGGGAQYPPVPLHWLRRRQTWPGPPEGPLTPEQRRYVATHRPLIDTGHMRDTIVAGEPVTQGDTVVVEIMPSVDYAADHELGTPKIRRRSFMYLVDPDDVDVAMHAMEDTLTQRDGVNP